MQAPLYAGTGANTLRNCIETRDITSQQKCHEIILLT